jgi:hypothetical protein
VLQPGKVGEVAQEMVKFGIDLIALQEIQWKGRGRIDKKEFSLYFSGPNKKTGQFGTGFM